MNTYRTERSQVQLGQGGELELKEPPSTYIREMPNVSNSSSRSNVDDNLKISGHNKPGSSSSPTKRSSERRSSRSLRGSSSTQLSSRTSSHDRHRSSERRSSERRSSRRQSSSRQLSSASSQHSNDVFRSSDRSEEKTRHSPRKGTSSEGLSRRSSHRNSSSRSPSRDRRRDSQRRTSGRSSSRKSLPEQHRSPTAPSHSRRRDSSRRRSSSRKSLLEKGSSERGLGTSEHQRSPNNNNHRRRRSHSRRRSSSRKPDSKRSPGSISEYGQFEDHSLNLSWGSPPPKKHDSADTSPFHAAISTPPFNSSKSLGKMDMLYGTQDAKAKEKARRGGSERVINPGVEHYNNSSNNSVAVNSVTVSTLYGDDTDAKAKAKASRGSITPSRPGVDRVFNQASGTSIWRRARSNSVSDKSHVTSDSSRASGLLGPTSNHGEQSTLGTSAYSKASTADTLYGSEADAKAKAKSTRCSGEISLSNPGVENVRYDHSSVASATTSTLYGSDAEAKARAKYSKYGLSPGSRTASTMGMASMNGSQRSVHSIAMPFEDEEGPIATKVSLSSSGSSKNEGTEGSAAVSSGFQTPNYTEESPNDDDTETTEVRKEERKKRRMLLLFLLLLLIGGGVAVWYFLFRDTHSSEDTMQNTSSAPSSSNAANEAPVLPFSSKSPSTMPSIWPTQELLYERPSQSDCESIARNQTIAGREDKENANFGIDLEVVLSDNITMTESLVEELMDAIQEKIVPSLAGCSVVVDRLLQAWRFVIFDAFVKGYVQPEEQCLDEALSGRNCYRIFGELSLFLKGSVRFLDIIRLISDEEVNFATNLGLSDPFQVVKMIAAKGLTPTASPTVMPSNEPSFSPSELPTAQPIVGPALVPIKAPTMFPTGELAPSSLTLVPSKAPTLVPTSELAISSPTLVPSKAPTLVPTSELPSSSPTLVPSEAPTLVPSSEDSISPTQTASFEPSPVPSTVRPPQNLPLTPTEIPVEGPSARPSVALSESPTLIPTEQPSDNPTGGPTLSPSESPSASPSAFPSASPSGDPSASPIVAPSLDPSPKPSSSPSAAPVKIVPTAKPTVAFFLLVVCGSNGGCLESDSFQNANYNRIGGLPTGTEIAVRCCSDTALPGFIQRNCLCPFAASEIAGVCHNSVNFFEALNLCLSVGARLCTNAELLGVCTSDLGCGGHDTRFIWSKTVQ